MHAHAQYHGYYDIVWHAHALAMSLHNNSFLPASCRSRLPGPPCGQVGGALGHFHDTAFRGKVRLFVCPSRVLLRSSHTNVRCIEAINPPIYPSIHEWPDLLRRFYPLPTTLQRMPTQPRDYGTTNTTEVMPTMAPALHLQAQSVQLALHL